MDTQYEDLGYSYLLDEDCNFPTRVHDKLGEAWENMYKTEEEK